MNTLFMNSKNSKTYYPQRLLLNLTDKINLGRKDKYIALSNFNTYYTQTNIKKSCRNNSFKIPAPTWNGEFEVPDGSYTTIDIQDYFKYIIKKALGKNSKSFNKNMHQKKQKTESRLKLKQDIILNF